MITGIEVVQAVLRKHMQVPVVSKVPEGRSSPPVFVRVDQAPPSILSPVHQRVRVMVQIYASDMEEAVTGAFRIRSILEDVEAYHPGAYGCDEITGPEEFPDPDVPRAYRWQVTGLLYMTSQ